MIGITENGKQESLKVLNDLHKMEILSRLMKKDVKNDNIKFVNEVMENTSKTEIVYIMTTENRQGQLTSKIGTRKEILDLCIGKEFAFEYNSNTGIAKRLA